MGNIDSLMVPRRAPIDRRLRLPCWARRMPLTLACIFLGVSAADSQIPAKVEVRLQLSWWDAPAHTHLRQATVVVEPLAAQGDPRTIRLVENTTSIASLAPGRYQLTTTTPLVVDGQAYGWSIELPLLEPVNTVRLTQENAVRLNVADFVAPHVAGLTPASTAPSSSQPDEGDRRQIKALLDRWAAALRSRNLNSLMSCYAPRLTSYNQQTNVSRNQVQLQKSKLLHTFTHVRSFDLSSVDVSVSNGQAKGTAIKTWFFSNEDATWHGRAEVYFEFAQRNSHWVITSERERPIPERELPTQQSAVNEVRP